MSEHLQQNSSPPDAAIVPARFDLKIAQPFCNKSVSDETRRAYRRIIAEFFAYVSNRHPREITPTDVLAWRDQLRGRRKKPATVAMKLAVLRSFFEYLRVAALVPINPAATRL